MFGTGGSALVSKTMGEGDRERANRIFSLLIYLSIFVGIVLTLLGFLLLRPVAAAMGAEGEMLEHCLSYGNIILLATPAYMLQYEFQSFFVTAEKPQLGLFATVLSGISNMVLDWLFVAVFSWGLMGAAAATSFSQYLGAVVAFLYFARPNPSLLRLGKTRFDGKAVLKTCTNGSSELMSNISMSLIGMLYNIQLIRYAGENGVAAYGVLMYVNMIFLAAFIGYSVGTAPVIGFHYGAGNHQELKSLRQKSLLITAIFSIVMFLASEGLARPLSLIFVSYDEALFSLTLRGFMIYSFSFLFSGFSIFGPFLFYRSQQRPGFRRHFFPAHAGVPGSGGAASAPGLGN